MFGLTLGGKLIQGSVKTWNYITSITNLAWYKFNHTNPQIMPRQRRRHHTRSRSRSRSVSHDKDRDVKRRKIEVYDSPNHKRSVSLDDAEGAKQNLKKTKENPKSPKQKKTPTKKVETNVDCEPTPSNLSNSNSKKRTKKKVSNEPSKGQLSIKKFCLTPNKNESTTQISSITDEPTNSDSEKDCVVIDEPPSPVSNKVQPPPEILTPRRRITPICIERKKVGNSPKVSNDKREVIMEIEKKIEENIENVEKVNKETPDSDDSDIIVLELPSFSSEPEEKTPKKHSTPVKETRDLKNKSSKTQDPDVSEIKDSIKLLEEKTPKKPMTPKQIQKKLESEKKRLQKEKEREDREKQKLEEKAKKEAEKQMLKDQKQKEKEIQEQKRKEKEEEKLKKQQEKEDEKLKKQQEKQQEIEEKNKEKQKEQEKKQKVVAAFASFFVPKKVNSADEKKTEQPLAFMPFEVKSDMKLPPPRRKPLTDEEKQILSNYIERNSSDKSYLKDIKCSNLRSCTKTWPNQDSNEEVLVIEDEENVGERICEEKPKTERMKAKFLKFRENQRPAYYGTWRKTSKCITGRKPFGKEQIFDYEVDSDDDWEEEEQGENLEALSDDDDKENEPENEDYEVDDEFFVPHGHLSDDEIDDEEKTRLSPSAQKQKLKLLKDAFDLDMKSQTQKIKPRSIGCIWYDKDGKNVDEAIHKYLHPLSVISNGQIDIKRRDLNGNDKPKNLPALVMTIPENLMPILLKTIHGRNRKKKLLATEFLDLIKKDNPDIEMSKATVIRHINNVAEYTTNSKIGKGKCWEVKEEIAEKYNFDLDVPISTDSTVE